MKRHRGGGTVGVLCVLSLLLLGACSPSAPEPDGEPPARADGAGLRSGGVVAELAELDFGVVEDVEEIARTVTLRTSGSEPVPMAAPEPTCGCLVTEPVGPFVIPPGEPVEIAVTFRPFGMQGEVRKALVLGSEDGRVRIRLPFRAEVDPRILVSPRHLSFGLNDRAAALPVRELTVATRDPDLELPLPRALDRHDGRPLEDLRVERLGEEIVEERGRPRRAHRFRVTWLLAIEPTELRGQLRFDLPREVATRAPVVNLSGRVVGKIMTHTGTVQLGSGVAGTPFERQVFFDARARGAEPPVVRVTGIDCPLTEDLQLAYENFSVPFGTRTRHGVRLSGRLPEGGDRLRVLEARLELRTDHPEAPVLPMRLEGHVRPDA